MLRIRAIVAAAVLAFGASAAGAPAPFHWEPAGWGGGGGFWSCAFHPTNGSILYMGGDVGGMYRSDDKGLHWRSINNGIASYAVHSIAIAPSEADTLYILTRGGVCRSTDGGSHWVVLPETVPGKLGIVANRPWSVRALAVDPTNSRIVWAGAPDGRIYRSADGGDTWKEAPFTLAPPPAPAAPTAAEPQPLRYPVENGKVILGRWEKMAREGWAAETRNAAFIARVDASREAAASGRGSLALICEGSAATTRSGWAKLPFYPVPADWTAGRKVTARFRIPPDAPAMEGQLGVMCGENWLWQTGPRVKGTPGEWVEVSLDLAGLKLLDCTRTLVFALYAPEQPYQGTVYLDDVVYEGEMRMAAATPVAAGPRGHAGAQSAGEETVITSIAIAEKEPRRMWASGVEAGILRSRDGGASWEQVDPSPFASCVTVAPSDPDVLYAAFNSERQMQKSTDGGATWRPINEGVPKEFTPREMVVDPRDPNVVHCIGNRGWDGTTGVSRDGGKAWVFNRETRRDLSANPTLPEQDYGGKLAKTSTYLLRANNLAISRANPDELYLACGWNPSFSGDGGRTWSERSRGADISCITDIRFCGSNTYASAMDEGLLMSADDGKSWRQLYPLVRKAGVNGHTFRVLAWRKGDADRIVAAHSPWEANLPAHVLLSDDGGATFQVVRQGLPLARPTRDTMWDQSYPRTLAVDPKDPDTLYLGMDGEPEGGRPGGGIFRSTDGGLTWERLPGQPGSRRAFQGLAVDPTDSRRIFWGTTGAAGGLYRSEDGGQTWERVFQQEPWILDFGISPTGVLYCGQRNLYRSRDHGATWEKLTDLKEDYNICAVEIDPQDEQRIWFSRVVPGDRAVGGIFRTTDGGTTWGEITGDIPYCRPYVLRYNPRTRELWAGGVGLYRIGQ